MADLFVGIDVGTGGVRACAIDARAEIIGTAAAPLPSPRQSTRIDSWASIVE